MSWSDIRKFGLVMFACLGLSGCLIRIILGLAYTDDLGTFISLSIDDVSVALCRNRTPDGSYASIECLYNIELDGSSDKTSTVELLQELGLFGLLVDPLILQVPDDIQLRHAAYESEFGSGDLEVLTARSVPIDAAGSLTAQPGTKLLIFDLPPEIAQHVSGTDPAAGLALDFDLLFERNLTSAKALDAFEIKALFTIPMSVGGIRYYIPMLPCVRSFAEVPAIDIDPSNDLTSLAGSLFGVVENSQGCNSQFYNFNSLGSQLVASHSDVNFGDVELGQTQNTSLTFSAAGINSLTIQSVDLAGAADFEVAQNTCTTDGMSPGDSCEVEVSFTPMQAGQTEAMLTIRSDDAYQSMLQIMLDGNGTKQAAQPHSACQGLDFGPAGSGQTVLGRNAFQNTGSANYTVASVAITGSADFEVVTDECTGRVLAPGFGCLIDLAFSSTAPATRTGELVMTSNAGTASSTLQGTIEDGLIHAAGFESRCDAAP